MSKTKKLIYIIIGIVLVFSLILKIIFEGLHEPGFYIVFGFIGAWALILFSKRILAPLLQKSEDYYGGTDES